MAIRFTRSADADVLALYLHSAEHWGVGQAERYTRGLRETFARLERNPKIARLGTEYEPSVRIHRCQAHVIVFREEADGILVIRIRHRRENWMSDPAQDRDPDD